MLRFTHKLGATGAFSFVSLLIDFALFCALVSAIKSSDKQTETPQAIEEEGAKSIYHAIGDDCRQQAACCRQLPGCRLLVSLQMRTLNLKLAEYDLNFHFEPLSASQLITIGCG